MLPSDGPVRFVGSTHQLLQPPRLLTQCVSIERGCLLQLRQFSASKHNIKERILCALRRRGCNALQSREHLVVEWASEGLRISVACVRDAGCRDERLGVLAK